jgi:hypothetical protein
MGGWLLLGQLLTAGGSFFGLIYAAPSLATLGGIFRGGIVISLGPAAALGLAGLALTGLGSFAAIIVSQPWSPDGNVGALLIFWTDFIVNLLGDALFYLVQPTASAVLLVGLSSAFLTTLGLFVIVQRPLPAAPGPA